jgi:hypothetical protein
MITFGGCSMAGWLVAHEAIAKHEMASETANLPQPPIIEFISLSLAREMADMSDLFC